MFWILLIVFGPTFLALLWIIFSTIVEYIAKLINEFLVYLEERYIYIILYIEQSVNYIKRINPVYIVLLVTLTLLGCGREDKKIGAYIDPAFYSHVSIFIEEGLKRGVNTRDKIREMRIEFIEEFPGKPTIGVCYKFGVHHNLSYLIQVSRKKWEKLSFLGQEWVMSHELGHCVLHKPHSHNKEDIMFAKKPFDEDILEDNYDFLYDILFTLD